MIIEGIVSAQENSGRDYILGNDGCCDSMRRILQKFDGKYVRVTIEEIEELSFKDALVSMLQGAILVDNVGVEWKWSDEYKDFMFKTPNSPYQLSSSDFVEITKRRTENFTFRIKSKQ